MHLNIVFVVHSFVAALSAFILLIVPKAFVVALGVPASDVTDIAIDFARLYSVCLVAIAILTWLARGSPSKYARRLAVTSMFLAQLVGLVVSYTIHYPIPRVLCLLSYGLFAFMYVYILLFRQADIEGPYPAP
jgi:hypothetical protein